MNLLDDRISRYNSHKRVFRELCWGSILLSEMAFRDTIVFVSLEIYNLFLLYLR